MGSPRQRLDVLLTERGLAPSRERARAVIMAGGVQVDGKLVDKPGAPVAPDCAIAILTPDLPYVSRGGLKLEGALAAFGLSVSGLACLDVGASTGGFTDCLLQHGAAQVTAVDVGYGQLAWRLRQDPRVVVVERTNIRYMPADRLPSAVDLVTIDASFISLRIVVPAVLKFLKPAGRILPLAKPQFEVGKGEVGKGGVVSDPAQHARVLGELKRFFEGLELDCSEAVPSPIDGPKGNREFFFLMRRRVPAG
ncbi:MAG TPA: TlyA family RNA methyltransferase [Desulfobacterales bacterium]|nr:TlyA family RNA methyltransferase [Desulfobacterales bacterium]